MLFNFRQIIVIMFIILAIGGVTIVIERENKLVIDNITPTETLILDEQDIIQDPVPTTDGREAPETTNQSVETEISLPKTPRPLQTESPSVQSEIIQSEITEEPAIEVSIEEPITSTPTISFSDINTKTREAVVNILCTMKSTGIFAPISGSGVLISEHGIILTNAHIAQYFLLKDYQVPDFVTCTIRTGSPAKPTYRAELLHISSEWIEENTNNIKEESPMGTGENDFAFLRITETTAKGGSVPLPFPFVEISTEDAHITKNTNVLLAGYSAGFLGGISIQKDLYMTSTITQIMEVFTFKAVTIDLFSVGGSIIAQAGSSGGAVVDGHNKLLGIIVTSSEGETTDERDLRALSLSHINRSLTQNSNTTLRGLLSGDLVEKAKAFNTNTAPILTKLLTDVLD